MCCVFLFFFNDTATTEIYTLSLHDALPIFVRLQSCRFDVIDKIREFVRRRAQPQKFPDRSEEHTSELQSHSDLVCRLLLEKKKKKQKLRHHTIKNHLHYSLIHYSMSLI